MGEERLIDTNFDKWNQQGVFGFNYFYATIDENQTPRRLNEGGSTITDYIVESYINKTLADSLFEVPSYCGDNVCPSSTICGQFRS